jgi:coenzyme F420-reducing hydrogenase gamma subunit
MRKLDIGWFSFTCCEDSTIIFTELANTRFKEWKKIFNFKHARIFKQKNEMGPFDIAFIEGATSSKEQEEKVKTIRNLSKKIVAIGACACIGMPSSQRNQFTPKQLAQIQFLLDRFKYSKKVKKLEDIIKVDYKVPGCPMNEKIFLKTIEEIITKHQASNNK